MQDWSLHSDNTGGYFQCNRFVQNLKVKDLPEGGSAELWAEESGNAHAETLRLREKNKRMARFIHHFTRFALPYSTLMFTFNYCVAHVMNTFFSLIRYQAHGESVQMEGRMFKETANRIRDGLLASLSGGSLKWLQGYQAPNPLLHNVCSGVSDSNSSSGASAGDTFPAVAMSGEKAPPAAQVHTTVTKSAMPATTIVHPLPDTVSYNYTHATRFLKDGFEELLKCRCVRSFPVINLFALIFHIE